MAAQQQQLDAVANDLANANTTGYKRRRVGFSRPHLRAGRPLVDVRRRAARHGSRAVDGRQVVRAGRAARTDRPLDVAIQGEGFIKVRLADGSQALTRDGNLQMDGRRRLVTSVGALVQPPITVPEGIAEDQLSIGPTAPSLAGGQQRRQDRGRQGALAAEARSPSAATPSSPPPLRQPVAAPAATVLTQGALETSNVDMSQSMVAMIEVQRAYQLASKAIQTADQMMEIANGVKR